MNAHERQQRRKLDREWQARMTTRQALRGEEDDKVSNRRNITKRHR